MVQSCRECDAVNDSASNDADDRSKPRDSRLAVNKEVEREPRSDDEREQDGEGNAEQEEQRDRYGQRSSAIEKINQRRKEANLECMRQQPCNGHSEEGDDPYGDHLCDAKND